MGCDGLDIMAAVFVLVSYIVWALRCNVHTAVCPEVLVGKCDHLRVLGGVCAMEAENGRWSRDSVFLDILYIVKYSVTLNGVVL